MPGERAARDPDHATSRDVFRGRGCAVHRLSNAGRERRCLIPHPPGMARRYPCRPVEQVAPGRARRARSAGPRPRHIARRASGRGRGVHRLSGAGRERRCLIPHPPGMARRYPCRPVKQVAPGRARRARSAGPRPRHIARRASGRGRGVHRLSGAGRERRCLIPHPPGMARRYPCRPVEQVAPGHARRARGAGRGAAVRAYRAPARRPRPRHRPCRAGTDACPAEGRGC